MYLLSCICATHAGVSLTCVGEWTYVMLNQVRSSEMTLSRVINIELINIKKIFLHSPLFRHFHLWMPFSNGIGLNEKNAVSSRPCCHE